MAAIASSTYSLDDHAQANGARYVVERHTTVDGRVITVGPYLLPAGQGDAEAGSLLAARVGQLEAMLAAQEAEALIDGA